MGLVARTLFLLTGPVLRWTADHPLRTAGGAAALLAACVVLVSVGVTVSPAGVEVPTTIVDRFVTFSRDSPAYPVAVVVGALALLFWR